MGDLVGGFAHAARRSRSAGEGQVLSNGVGTFETDDTLRGKPIRVRFTWSKITPTSAHWEQAFSPDGGKTWEMNWTMEFERVS